MRKKPTKSQIIEKLQSEKSELIENLELINFLLTAELNYLGSDKFCGAGNQFVNSSEMFTKILLIRSKLNLSI